MPAIPDRWIPYKACGNVIEGTRLICFKVPLKKGLHIFCKEDSNDVCNNINDLHKLDEPQLGASSNEANENANFKTPTVLLSPSRQQQTISDNEAHASNEHKVQTWNKEIKEIWDIPALLQKIPKLGAVIDLTNTARYYDPAELQAAGVLHKKILMPGRIIPPEDKVTEFMDTVDEFLGKNCVAMQVKRASLGLSTTELLIGVHCTHGLNRTGYMVCRYMRDRLGVPAKDAIKKFEKARGYQIERENYIADLLGIAPGPPELGKNTDIKPVSNKPPYKRSPLAEDEDEDADRNRDRYNRYNNRLNNRNIDRYNGRRNTGNDNNGFWKSRGDNDTNWRRRPDSESSTSYDYRHDY